MITAFVFKGGSLTKSILSGTANLAVAEALPPVDNLPSHVQAVAEHAADTLSRDAVWVDLCNPLPSEIAAVERAFGMEVPTREEMGEIEASSRLYTENGALVMTAPILHRATAEFPESGVITFILLAETLVTVRFVDPLPFAVFARRAERNPGMAATAQAALMGLLESITDRLADVLELAQADMEHVSRDIFAKRAALTAGGQSREARRKAPDLQETLRRIGRVGDLATKARDSLLGLSRIAVFLNAQVDMKKDIKARIKTLSRDIASITDHAHFLAGKVNFLLDATLGLINIEQNAIIKIFTVAAVAFLPPTLIASIYGMNFDTMPELHWAHGYLFAIGLMVLSAIVPMWYFRRRGWL
ncbi:MAG TPA: magnesium transporter CorA family protein [Dongiaceae bacterium]|jgi:magnesium transporter|nr:magnesium transporter CorA family protein [Dongiaceae bacterium]